MHACTPSYVCKHSDMNPLLRESFAMFKFMGLDFDHDIRLFICIVFATSVPIWTIVAFNYVELWFQYRGIDSVVKCIDTTLSLIQITLRLYVLAAHKDDLLALIRHHRQFVQETPVIRDVLVRESDETFKKALFFMRVYFAFYCGLCLYYIVLTVSDLNKYPDLVRAGPFYELTATCEALAYYFCLFSSYGSDSLFVGLIVHVIVHLNKLEALFKRAHLREAATAEDRRESLRLLETCSEYHRHLKDFVNRIKKILSYAFVVILLSTMMLNCFGMYGFISEGTSSFKSVVVALNKISFYSALSFFYCAFGAALYAKFDSVSDWVFRCGWWNIPDPYITKTVAMIQHQVQRPEYLSVFGSISFNYPTYVKMMRFTFSLYTVLDSIKTKK